VHSTRPVVSSVLIVDNWNGASVRPEDLIVTDLLAARVAGSPDLMAEARAFHELSRLMIEEPDRVVPRFLEIALELCAAGSAGLSILTKNERGEEVFRWNALAGRYAPYVGGTTPRNFSPCGLCLDRGEPILVAHPARLFTYINEAADPVVEGLVLPLYDTGRVPLGTLWIVSHDEAGSQFTAETVRVMTQLAVQLVLALKITRQATNRRREREGARRRVDALAQLVKELKAKEAALRASEEFSRRVLESSPDCLKVLDPTNGAVVYINGNGLCAMEIDDFATIRGAEWASLWPEPMRSSVWAAVAAARTGSTARFEGLRPTAKGTPRWWEVAVMPIESPSGDVERLLSISRDVTDRHHAEEALREARETAERTSAAKTRLLAATGHDLRQPLTVIVGSLELLAGKVAKKYRPLLERADHAAERLNKAFDSLMAAARLEFEGITVATERFCIGRLLDELFDQHQADAMSKRLRFQAVACGLYVRSDPALLGGILHNLVGNAIKYTDEGGVLIGCRRRRGSVLIQVWDTGSGIPADQLGTIFDEFRQLAPAASRGVGLGLSIAKRTADALGHRLGVLSTPGKGSCFEIEVPLGLCATGEPHEIEH
jgi:PAS domain S-box-containing protein